MKATPCAIPDVVLFEPRVFGDTRGFFFESYNQRQFEAAIGRQVNFVQDNHSRSVRNVLRGLHYQVKQPQGKLVHVIMGEVFDVAVDIRKSSPTFGKWVGEILSAENKKQLWIPRALPMALSCCPNTPNLFTKPQIIGRPSMSAVLPGMIRLWQLTGTSAANLCFLQKTRKEWHSMRRRSTTSLLFRHPTADAH